MIRVESSHHLSQRDSSQVGVTKLLGVIYQG